MSRRREGAIAIVTGARIPQRDRCCRGPPGSRRRGPCAGDGPARRGRRKTAAEPRGEGLVVEFEQHDATDEQAWERVIEACTRTFGIPTILCNNAGVFNGVPLAEENLDGWARTIDANLTSVFLGMGGGAARHADRRRRVDHQQFADLGPRRC